MKILEGRRGRKSDSEYFVEFPEVPSDTRANAEAWDG